MLGFFVGVVWGWVFLKVDMSSAVLFFFWQLFFCALSFIFSMGWLEEGIGHSIPFLLETCSLKFYYKPISNCPKMCLRSLLNLRSHRIIKIPSGHAVHILHSLRSANSVTLPLTLNMIHYSSL